MAQSMMLSIEKHFTEHGWIPMGPFNCAVQDIESGCIITYWKHKYNGEVKMFIIDGFSDDCPCDTLRNI